jgi:predicted nucleic acid-binding protein
LRTWLLDTGPLVAYLVASEKEHPQVVARLDAFTGQLVTTNAVITEAMHFVVKARKGPALLADFVVESGLQVVDFSQAGDLEEAARRMEKYANLPMDYADATLVLLGERLKVFEILTLDRRGFSVYRTARGKRFTLLLDQPGLPLGDSR